MGHPIWRNDRRQVVAGPVGLNTYAVPPGHHRVSAWVQHFPVGEAAIDVTVNPGQALQIYAAPHGGRLTPGVIGLVPQKATRAGFQVGIVLFVVLLLAVAAIIIVAG
ncbi:MAG: hypothetical protein ACK5LS_02380 [Propioniciclava sp.]